MRYIKIPAPVVIDTVVDTKTGKHFEQSFDKFVCFTLLADAKASDSDSSIDKAMSIGAKVRASAVGDVVTVSDEDHEFLQKLATSVQFHPDMKFFLLPLMKAITGAARAAPTVEEPARSNGAHVAAAEA